MTNNNNVMFENNYVESVSFAGETLFFIYQPTFLDTECQFNDADEIYDDHFQ